MKRVGIVGGGQLARMLAMAGRRLGIRCEVLDPAERPCAASVARHLRGDFDDLQALDHLVEDCSVATFDFENVAVGPLAHLSQRMPVRPPPKALAVAQDRLEEKRFISELNIPVADFLAIDRREDLDAAVDRLGLPCLIKTRRFGYDGKGQWKLRERADCDAVWNALQGTPAIAEAWVPFKRELSLIVVRDARADHRLYPLTENHHVEGILCYSLAPAAADDALRLEAERLAFRLADALDYVGLLAIELFEMDGHLMVNEIAPRVHNSGHWTIEGAHCSQFENHLRAVTDLPLGDASARGYTLMLNVVGQWPQREALLACAGVNIHDYEKSAREGRKIGHLTVCADSVEELALRSRALLTAAGRPALWENLQPRIKALQGQR